MLLQHFTCVRDVSALPVNKFQKNNLSTRIVSALVMMPVVIASTYLGYPYFNFLVGLCAALIAWEYSRIISSGHADYEGKGLIISLVGAVLVASTDNYTWAFILLGLISVVFLGIVLAKSLFYKSNIDSPEMGRTIYPINSLWMVVGGAYMGGACISLIWIRNEWDNGLLAVMWILAVVWASDCGAYAVGRLIGGPKLAPKISPNKTWAGLAGCAISACIVGAIVSKSIPLGNLYELIVISGLIGLVSQMGDLVESAFKRHFGVKDASDLIPGHGGVLDRVDALLAAIFAVALISLVNKGPLLL
jgi:phosphatidate cytidylyltransferase